ncbi:MAG: iron permease [Gammaproteobacteria bacterium]|nr:MAG: iron permease [Gammaproteobacteria bacterium]RLA20688.1 MAG: iron permease [Gammaproteobacteria bacterium]
MLLNAVILTLREVIEASLIVSLFLAFCQLSGQPKKTILAALFLGLLSAILYAFNISAISQWQNGIGQEIVNASICFLVYLFLLIFLATFIKSDPKSSKQLQSLAMVVGITLATTQEGAEIILYLLGFTFSPELFRPVLFGSLIGAGIGLSFGIFIYYLLINVSKKSSLRIGFIMILLIAGSMIMQAIQLLTQIDWISSQYPLWDSSAFINERSLTGQLLYALIGYEATPTPIQVISYVVSLMLILALSAYLYFRDQRQPNA